MTQAADRFRRLYTELRKRICLLDYPPGTRLSEEQLAAEFGISRTPLRRVLARLEDEGLVAARHGVGTLVTDIDPREVAQVYALRMELAQLAGTLSPVPVTGPVLAQAVGLARQGNALADSPDMRGFAMLNMDHHGLWLTLTGNVALRDMLDRLYFQTARIWLNAVPHLNLAEECAIFADELRQTRDALVTGDVLAAALIRRAHIAMSVQRISRFAPDRAERSAASDR